MISQKIPPNSRAFGNKTSTTNCEKNSTGRLSRELDCSKVDPFLWKQSLVADHLIFVSHEQFEVLKTEIIGLFSSLDDWMRSYFKNYLIVIGWVFVDNCNCFSNWCISLNYSKRNSQTELSHRLWSTVDDSPVMSQIILKVWEYDPLTS